MFSAADTLGVPTYTMSRSANNYAAVWLNNSVTGVSGTYLPGDGAVRKGLVTHATSATRLARVMVDDSP